MSKKINSSGRKQTNIGNFIRQQREIKGVASPGELDEKASLPELTTWLVENGLKENLSLSEVQAYANALEVDESQIYTLLPVKIKSAIKISPQLPEAIYKMIEEIKGKRKKSND